MITRVVRPTFTSNTLKLILFSTIGWTLATLLFHVTPGPLRAVVELFRTPHRYPAP